MNMKMYDNRHGMCRNYLKNTTLIAMLSLCPELALTVSRNLNASPCTLCMRRELSVALEDAGLFRFRHVPVEYYTEKINNRNRKYTITDATDGNIQK